MFTDMNERKNQLLIKAVTSKLRLFVITISLIFCNFVLYFQLLDNNF